MDPQTLQTLSRQLARWAEEAIDGGRFPFRRAETFLPLITEEGEIRPHLVLWINRDSFMAAGILIFPPREAEEAVAAGSACARALGLRHFAAWGTREVVFWEMQGESPVRHRTYPLPAGTTPASFREMFHTVLEEFKMLAVIGAIPAPDLPPAYLANLCRSCHQSAMPPLIEAFRIALGEGVISGAPPGRLAFHQASLALLRILALLLEDRLPSAIRPEGLDRTLRFAIDALPPDLCRILEPAAWELPLPQESAVRLHHLLHRLSQVRFGEDRMRAARTLEILLTYESRQLGGYPLPAADSLPPGVFLVNPDRLCPEAAAEIAPLPLLAHTALLRHLRGEPVPLQIADVFALGDQPRPRAIVGTLVAEAPLSAAERQSNTARLRLSWPNRRFSLPPRAPRWQWEMLHLLGLLGEGGILDLITPDDWLTAPWARPLCEAMQEQFTFENLERSPAGLRVRLRQGTPAGMITRLAGRAGRREIPGERLRCAPPAFLSLALDLPEPLFAMLEDGRLEISEQGRWPKALDRAIFLFSHSTPGRQLWQVISGGEPLPSRRDLDATLLRHGYPLPASEVLNHLQTFPWPSGEEPTTVALDQELAPWLGVFSGGEALPGKKRNETRRLRRRKVDLAETIAGEVFRDGIPRFPEQYLYAHYRPELTEYRFSGHLTAGEEFFSRITLSDGAGEALTVDGGETARALLLASYSMGSPVALPRDRTLTATLLDRYTADLHRLRQSLVREVHRRVGDPREAGTLIDRIWNALPLPPWRLLSE